jgi:hypothetical protein
MKTPIEIENELCQYSGTYYYYKVGFGNNYVLTDGIKKLIELCECAWLIDIVWSAYPKTKKQDFQVWKITTKNNTAIVSATDGNDNIIYKQKIEYTDFPLESFEFYCTYGSLDGVNSIFVIMLKNEY